MEKETPLIVPAMLNDQDESATRDDVGCAVTEEFGSV